MLSPPAALSAIPFSPQSSSVLLSEPSALAKSTLPKSPYRESPSSSKSSMCKGAVVAAYISWSERFFGSVSLSLSLYQSDAKRLDLAVGAVIWSATRCWEGLVSRAW